METKETDLKRIKHTCNMLHDTIQHMRADMQQLNDPRAQTIFKTGIEVLLGLTNAMNDYEQENKQAWQAPPIKESSGKYEGIL